MREIKSTCYQRSFTSRCMMIVLPRKHLNLSCCEGKLKPGLSCHHSFNNDKCDYVKSRTKSDLDKSFAKCRDSYHIGSKSKTSEARKRKEQRKKSKNRRLNTFNNRRKRACIIFRSLGGTPGELCYEPDIYGIQQIDSVDKETLLLFTSKTDKACLRDLLDSNQLFYGRSWKTSSWFLLYTGST